MELGFGEGQDGFSLQATVLKKNSCTEREMQRCQYPMSIQLSTDQGMPVRKLTKVGSKLPKTIQGNNLQSSHMARNSAFSHKSG